MTLVVMSLRGDVTVRRRNLQVGATTRSFLEVVPTHRATSPALVLMLHGTLQTARSIRPFAGYSFDAYAHDGHAVVIYPDGLHREWNGARATVMIRSDAKNVDDVGFIRALIDRAASNHDIDRNRVYVVGFSLGGQMVIRLIHEIPERLAGAAILGAALPKGDNLVVARDAEQPLPVLTMHGTADPLAPFGGGPAGFHGHLPKGDHLSAADTAAYFAHRNAIAARPAATTVLRSRVTRYDYTAAGAAPVRFYAINGGGHVIPNPNHRPAPWFWGPTISDVVAAEAIAEFFDLPTTKDRDNRP
jgi:polyhydroxybutyrate depolymerase